MRLQGCGQKLLDQLFLLGGFLNCDLLNELRAKGQHRSLNLFHRLVQTAVRNLRAVSDHYIYPQELLADKYVYFYFFYIYVKKRLSRQSHTSISSYSAHQLSWQLAKVMRFGQWRPYMQISNLHTGADIAEASRNQEKIKAYRFLLSGLFWLSLERLRLG